MTNEQIAQLFHEQYELLAPSFSYSTREESRKPWADVPPENKALMIAVCGKVRESLQAASIAPQDDLLAAVADHCADLDRCAEALREYPEFSNSASEIQEAAAELRAASSTIAAPAQPTCRDDGRCQYAIDCGAEGMGTCPVGQCCQPRRDAIAAPTQEPVAHMVFHPDGSNLGPYRFRDEQITDMERRGHTLKPLVYAAPAVQQEPVAWVREDVLYPTSRSIKFLIDDAELARHYTDYRFEGRVVYKVTPLYAAPAVQAQEPKLVLALHAAVSALYFDDSSDFKSTLGTVVRHLDGGLASELLCNPKSAYDKACAMLAPAPKPDA